jgi:hypothetical protein
MILKTNTLFPNFYPYYINFTYKNEIKISAKLGKTQLLFKTTFQYDERNLVLTIK